MLCKVFSEPNSEILNYELASQLYVYHLHVPTILELYIFGFLVNFIKVILKEKPDSL